MTRIEKLIMHYIFKNITALQIKIYYLVYIFINVHFFHGFRKNNIKTFTIFSCSYLFVKFIGQTFRLTVKVYFYYCIKLILLALKAS